MSEFGISLDGKELSLRELDPDAALLPQLRNVFDDQLLNALEVERHDGRHLLTDSETLTDLGLDFESSLAFYMASRPPTSVVLDGEGVGTVQLNSDSALLRQLRVALGDRLPTVVKVQHGTERQRLDGNETLDSLGLDQPTSLLLFTAQQPKTGLMKRLLVPALIALLLVGGLGVFVARSLGSTGTRTPTVASDSNPTPIVPTDSAPAAVDVPATAVASTSAPATVAPTDAPTTTAPTSTPAPTGAVAARSESIAPVAQQFGKDADAAIKQLQTNGSLIVGVRFDAPPFGFDVQHTSATCDDTRSDRTFQPIGFDIDIARDMVERWLPNKPDAVALRCVPIEKRLGVVTTTVTLGAFALSGTADRCKLVACSIVYIEDGLGLLVNPSSGIDSVCDLEGKKIVVSAGSSAESLFLDSFKRWCSSTNPPQLTSDVGEDRAVVIKEVQDGRADAYSTSVKILNGLYTSTKGNLVVVEDAFAPEGYVLATAPTETGLLQLINLTLEEMKADGTYDIIYRNWFGCDSVPTNIRIVNSTRPDYVKRTDALPHAKCPDESAPVKTYTVQRGELLGYVAQRVYGDWSLYQCIMKANNINDPRKVQIGQVLTIPPKDTCAP